MRVGSFFCLLQNNSEVKKIKQAIPGSVFFTSLFVFSTTFMISTTFW